jgi:hypothetical protein
VLTENVYIKKALVELFSSGILICEIRSQWSQRATVKEVKNMFFNKNNRKEESVENPEVMNDNYGILLDQLAKNGPIFNDDLDDKSNSNR